MKTILCKSILFLGLLLSPALIIAQTEEKDFDNIRKTYANMKEYSMDVEYKMYKDYTSPIAFENINMSLKKNGSQYYNKLSGSETLINNKYVVVLSHKSKTLMIDKYVKPSSKKPLILKDAGIDSLFAKVMKSTRGKDSLQVKTKVKDISLNEKQYTIIFSKGDYSSISFNYDVNTFLVKRATFYLRNKMQINENETSSTPRMEIVFRNVNQHPGFDANTFSEAKYVVVHKNGSLELSSSIKNYKTINHLVSQ